MEFERRSSGIFVPKFRDLHRELDHHDEPHFYEPEMARIAKKHGLRMTDGNFYQDTRYPHIYQNPASVSLLSTNKALYPASQFTTLGSNYWRIAKKLRVEVFGRITTVVTPGNGQFAVYWGSGADATGTILQSTTAAALTANQTNLSWFGAFKTYCTAEGTSGTLFTTGWFIFNESVLASKQFMPASAAATSATLDITTASILSLQFNRSGSTAETMQLHDMDISSYN